MKPPPAPISVPNAPTPRPINPRSSAVCAVNATDLHASERQVDATRASPLRHHFVGAPVRGASGRGGDRLSGLVRQRNAGSRIGVELVERLVLEQRRGERVEL